MIRRHHSSWFVGEYIGLSDPFEEPAIGTKCRECQGSGRLQVGTIMQPVIRTCYACDGMGWAKLQFVNLMIRGRGEIYKEKVLNELVSPGIDPPRRPSRLYLLLRNISGLKAHGPDQVTVAEIRRWMEETPLPVPVTVQLDPARFGYTLCVKHPTHAILS